MTDKINEREKLSALVDGQLQSDQLASSLDFATQGEGREAWQIYHLVGDVLRSPERARQADGGEFLARLREQLAQEPPQQPPVFAPISVPVQAANDPVFRWKMVAGLASIAAVSTLAWSLLGNLMHPTGAQQPMATAHSTALVAEGQAVPIMIRDPRLDELLAAHKQFGGASALQLPAGFLRNATFEAPSH